MKIPRSISGAHFADVLCKRWEYSKVNQVGSHMILETETPGHQRITIPQHDPLRLGTFSSLLRMIGRHKGVTRDAILATL